jgi:hypothetical protein
MIMIVKRDGIRQGIELTVMFEILMVVTMKIALIWDMTRSSLIIYQMYRVTAQKIVIFNADDGYE